MREPRYSVLKQIPQDYTGHIVDSRFKVWEDGSGLLGFLTCGTVDIWGSVILCGGTVLCFAGC